MNDITITLRELARSDLSSINRWRNTPELVGLLGGSFRHVCVEVDQKWYDGYLAQRSTQVRLAIEMNSTLVGAAYLLGMDPINRDAEYAIWVGEPHAQGKGVGEFATRGMLRHAFDDLNLERVHLTVLKQNERAIRLYRKVGFVEEGINRRALFKQGRYVDVMMMSILRDEHNRSRLDSSCP